MSGIYAEHIHMKKCCLRAVGKIPDVSSNLITENVDASTRIWLALHDTDQVRVLCFCGSLILFRNNSML